MNLRHLRTLVAVVQSGSFAEAARRLSVAHPAISRDIKIIEEALGAKLFNRSVRGVELTEPGERIYHHALDIIDQFDVLPRLVEGGEIIAGRVALGLPYSVSRVLALPMLAKLQQELPNVQFHLVEAVSGQLEEWFEAGRLDLAVLFDTPEVAAAKVERVAVEDLYLVGRPESELLSANEVSFVRLDGIPLILPGNPHGHRRLLDSLALSFAIDLNILFEIDSIDVTLQLIRAENVFAVLSRGAVLAQVEEGTLAITRVVEPVLGRSVSIATASRRGTSRACEATRQILKPMLEERLGAGQELSRRR